MAKRKINWELLERVKAKIKRLCHPRHFDMETYGAKTSCGTAACIAGHTLLMTRTVNASGLIDLTTSDNYEDEISVFYKAQAVLGLTDRQAQKLFLLHNWPWDFKHRYWDAGTAAERRNIAIERIDKFIQTKGRR